MLTMLMSRKTSLDVWNMNSVEQMGAPETASPVQEQTSPEWQVESESQESHTSISPWSSKPPMKPALQWSTKIKEATA